MENFKISLDLEPSDNYKNAEKKLVSFIESFYKLTEEEKYKLLVELFGIANVQKVMDLLKLLINKNSNY